MSVIPLKADIRQRELRVRYVPQADIGELHARCSGHLAATPFASARSSLSYADRVLTTVLGRIPMTDSQLAEHNVR